MTNCHYRPALLASLLGEILACTVTGSVHAAPPSAIAAETAPAKAMQKSPPISKDVGSYDVGLMLGSQIEHNGLTPNMSMESLLRGLKDAVGGRPVSAEERDLALRFMRESRDALAQKNEAAGKAFLAKNAKEPGITAMPSGLQYRVLAAGEAAGKPPLPADNVTVRYTASLTDGTIFDRSDTHDRPATFRVDSVFKGWQEAFLAMKPGAKWQLFVPPELGYGANSPAMVPPGAVLVYELELLRVDPQQRTAPVSKGQAP